MELKNQSQSLETTKLTAQNVESLSEQIGVQVRDICDEAALRVNAILAIYGMSAKIAISFDGLQDKKIEATKKKPSKAKKQKQINLNSQDG